VIVGCCDVKPCTNGKDGEREGRGREEKYTGTEGEVGGGWGVWGCASLLADLAGSCDRRRDMRRGFSRRRATAEFGVASRHGVEGRRQRVMRFNAESCTGASAECPADRKAAQRPTLRVHTGRTPLWLRATWACQRTLEPAWQDGLISVATGHRPICLARETTGVGAGLRLNGLRRSVSTESVLVLRGCICDTNGSSRY